LHTVFYKRNQTPTDFIGNGTFNVISFNYKIVAETDLVVTISDDSGVEFPTLILGTDYSVTFVAGIAGGSITLIDTGQDFIDGGGNLKNLFPGVLLRIRPETQDTDIRNQGDFFPEVHEDTFDNLTMIDQQQQDEINRSAKVPATSSAIVVLPVPEDGKIPTWSGNDGDMINTDNDPASAAADAAAADASATAAAADAAAASADAAAAAVSAATFPVITPSDAFKIIEGNAGGTAFNFVTFLSKLQAETNIAFGGIAKFKKGADIASTAAMTLLDDGNFFDITGTQTITSIVIKTAGTVVYLQFDDVLTVTDGSNLTLLGDFTTKAGSVLVLASDGTNWHEVSRAGTLQLENGVEIDEISASSDFSGATNKQGKTALAIKNFVDTEILAAAGGALTLKSVTVASSAINTGDIVIEPSRQYLVTFVIDSDTAVGNPTIDLRFNSDAGASNYQFLRSRVIFSNTPSRVEDGDISNSSISFLQIPNIANFGYLRGKFFIDTYKIFSDRSASINGNLLMKTTTSNEEDIHITGLYNVDTVITDFELFADMDVNFVVRLYELQQS